MVCTRPKENGSLCWYGVMDSVHSQSNFAFFKRFSKKKNTREEVIMNQI